MPSQHKLIELSGTVPSDLFNKRLDLCLAQMFPDFSRSKIKHWIEDGAVRVNGDVLTLARYKMKGDEMIEICAEQAVQVDSIAQALPLNIVFEDEHIIVIDKDAGMVVHPGAGNHEGTLLNALLAHYPPIDAVPRAGIVHRLDKDTTGLMVVAKTLEAQKHLVEQLQSRSMGREYEAVVLGQLIAGGMVDEPIGRHPSKRTLMTVRHSGKEATTHYRVIEKFRAHSHLRLKLETGRTHQIRVHMAHLKHPLVGDGQYGGRPRIPKKASEDTIRCLQTFKRQALHAVQLSLTHPIKGEEMSWQSPLPEDFQYLLKVLQEDTLAHLDDML